MADNISGIKNITPSYPVKPVQPSPRDRESGKRRKEPVHPEVPEDDDTTDKPVIDEYI